MPQKPLIISILIFVAIVIGVAVGAYLFPQLLGRPYYAVYLTTGEIYIGHLSKFPRMTLTDAYLLQVVQALDDPTRTDFQLTPLSNAIWAPTKIYLDSDQVVFYAQVGESSRAAQILQAAAKGEVPQANQQPLQQQQLPQQPVVPLIEPLKGEE